MLFVSQSFPDINDSGLELAIYAHRGSVLKVRVKSRKKPYKYQLAIRIARTFLIRP